MGFCGKIYPALDIGKDRYGSHDAWCFSLEEVDAFVDAHYNQREIDGYRGSKYKMNKRWFGSYRRRAFEKFFDQCKQQQTAFAEVFLLGSPIFVASTTRWNPICEITHNDSLKDLDFFRVFDTYTAFQEIAMYLGSQAQPNNPIPNVSDRDMVVAKGFDQFSFRKDPGKKKRKRKNNG